MSGGGWDALEWGWRSFRCRVRRFARVGGVIFEMKNVEFCGGEGK